MSNPAETGTLLLEFGTLSKLTGKPIFYDKAKRALVETYKRRSSIGLVGSSINVETGAWTDNDSHISGGIDSYYEYLWKCWLLFGDKDCLEMWNASIPAVHKYLADETGGELVVRPRRYGHGPAHRHDLRRARRILSRPARAFGRHPPRAALTGSSFKMWNLHGIEPEVIDYKTMKVDGFTYHLRPEIVESTYYLHHYTGDPEYRKMGETIFNDFVKYCRVGSRLRRAPRYRHERKAR